MKESLVFKVARRVLPRSLRNRFWMVWFRSQMLLGQIRLLPLRLKAISQARKAVSLPRTPHQVVFVADQPMPRVAKLAHGLKQAGWQVVLLHKEEPNFHATRYFVKIKRYQNPWEALKLAADYKPVVYHVFSCWHFEVAAAFIRYKPGKVVFDDYDVLAGMIKKSFLEKNHPGQLQLEKECLEKADGLCCRGTEVQYARKHLHYQPKGKEIFFPDYCWGFKRQSQSANPSGNDEIHLVYCGNVAVEKQNPNHKGCGDFLWLVELLAKKKIHFHLYPSHWEGDFEEAFSDYFDLVRRSPYFHLHHPVMADDLIDELRHYSCGLLIIGSRIHVFSGHPVYLPAKAYHGMSNKIFDYLDGGLPVIIHNSRLILRMLKRYGVALLASRKIFDNAQITLVNFLSPNVKEAVKKARKDYSIIRHVPRIIKFYQSL